MGILIQIGFLAATAFGVINGQEGIDIYYSPSLCEILSFSVFLLSRTVGSSHSFRKPSFLEIKGLAYDTSMVTG